MEKSQLIFAILFGTLVFMLLAFFLLFFLIRYRWRSNKYIQERENLKKDFEQTLLSSQIEVQENTLSELSRELHDNICQLLVTTKSYIANLQRTMILPPATLQVADETLGIAINELRSLSKSLDKEWLNQFNFIDNLTNEVKRINALQILHVRFTHPEKILMQPEEQIILFRIVQEAIQNAVKHSQATHIDVDVSNSITSLMVNITDDGKGIPEASLNSSGLGVKNMKHRTQMLGGTIEWASLSPAGSSVIIKLPVKKSES